MCSDKITLTMGGAHGSPAFSLPRASFTILRMSSNSLNLSVADAHALHHNPR